jgi:hypothetical protein
MGRRPLAGRDRKIIQGQRRDEFFKKMRRKGGVARTPAMGLAQATAADTGLADTTPMEEAEAQFEAAAETTVATEEEVAAEEEAQKQPT